MRVLHRDQRGRHRRRALPLRRAVTLAATATLLAGVTTTLAPVAFGEGGGDTSLTLRSKISIEALARAVALSPDGQIAYTVGSKIKGDSPGTLSIVDIGDESVVSTVSTGNDASAVAVSPDGKTVYVGAFNDSYQGAVYVVDADSQAVSSVVVSGEISSLALAPTGDFLYVTTEETAADYTGSLDVIDTSTSTVIESIPFQSLATGVTVSPIDGQIFVTTGDFRDGSLSGGLYEVDPDKLTSHAILNTDTPLSAVALSPDGGIGYTLGTTGSTGQVSAFDLATGDILSTTPVAVAAVSIAVSPDGEAVYVASPNFSEGVGSVSALSTADGSLLATINLDTQTESIAVSNDGSTLYVSGYTKLYTLSSSLTGTGSGDGGDTGTNPGDGSHTGNPGGSDDSGSTGGSNTGTPTAPSTPVTSKPVVSTVPAGGTASSTPASKPNATTPVIASVQSPVAGQVSFTAVAGPVDPPAGSAGAYTMLGRSFVIEAPTTTPDKPLSLTFTIADSVMPVGLDASDVVVFRDGVAVPDCKVPNATKADPDPCIVGRSSVNDVKSIRVLSSHASTWTFGIDVGNRIAGSNRYATAAQLATQFGTADAIVVANGIDAKNGADALAANYLAGRANAPIVLAQANRVETETLAAVKAVLKGAANPTIYVMGGADSISDAVANQIKTAAASAATGTVTIKRIGGVDRYATSALAATTPGSVTNSMKLSADGTAATTAILASGEVNADALAAGALSYGWGIPVLLTRSGQLPKSVADAITAQKITQLIVLGGSDRVSQAVLDQAGTAGVTSIKRIAGADRFDTSAQLYTFAMATLTDGSGNHYGADGGTVYLANGVIGVPDALAVGPLAGTSGSVLLTVRPNTLGDPAATFIRAHAGGLGSVTGLGSAPTIAGSVLAQAAGLL